jgi:hypothetical protein
LTLKLFLKQQKLKDIITFEQIANEYFNLQTNLSEKYIKNNKSNLERNIYPFLMEKDINDITSFEMIEIIKKMEAKGIIETAHRVFNLIERIFKYAVTIGKAKKYNGKY